MTQAEERSILRRRAGLLLLSLACAAALAAAVQTVCSTLSDRVSPERYTAAGIAAEAVEAIEPDALTVWVNEADADTLRLLPGIGESLSAAILEDRQINGPFHYLEDMTAVNGIGLKKVQKIREEFVIPGQEE